MLRKILIFHLVSSGAFRGPLTPPSRGSRRNRAGRRRLMRWGGPSPKDWRLSTLPRVLSSGAFRAPLTPPSRGSRRNRAGRRRLMRLGGAPSPKDWRLSTLPRGEGDDAGRYNQIGVLKIQISNQMVCLQLCQVGFDIAQGCLQ